MRYLSVLLVLVSVLACADTRDYSELKARLGAAFPKSEITAVEPSPVEGLVRVELDGRERIYTTTDGRFLLSGEMFEVSGQGKVANLDEQRLQGVRQAGLKAIDDSQTITYAAQDEKAQVYVFTDVTCGYCRRFHQHISEYNKRGITVHYLAFPRGGMDSRAAETMRAVWCAKDRREALAEAKLKGMEATPPGGCKDPVARQYRMGLEFGVRGTPAVYTSAGEYIGGYLSPEELAVELGLQAPRKE